MGNRWNYNVKVKGLKGGTSGYLMFPLRHLLSVTQAVNVKAQTLLWGKCGAQS